MSMSNVDPIMAMVEAEEDSNGIQVDAGVGAAIVRSEVDAQLSAAHKYPRSIGRFLKESITLATMSQEIAESCIYTLPRAGKNITGPSVRLAEIMSSTYGNMHIGTRVVDETDREIVAQGVCWDLQANLRVSVEARRRITGSNGKRYSDDMVTVTGNAAASIALRNAIFRVVPRSFVMAVYDRARAVAVGSASTLVDRRADILGRLQKLGVSQERVLARLERRAIEDLGLEDLETLIGLGTAIKNGDQRLDDVFPEPSPAPAEPSEDGKRISMGKGKKSKEQAAPSREPGEEG
jgi:hypothetical protein